VPQGANSELIARAILEQLRAPLEVDTAELPTWDQCAQQLYDLYAAVLR
jgi:hypothetical protein